MRSSDSSPYREPDEESLLEWETQAEQRRLWAEKSRRGCALMCSLFLLAFGLHVLIGIAGIVVLVVMAFD